MVITMERQAISEFCMVAMIVDKTAPRHHAQTSYRATSNFIQHALPVLFYFLKGCEISIDSYSSQIQSAAHTDGLDSCSSLLPHKGSPIITKRFLAQFFSFDNSKIIVDGSKASGMSSQGPLLSRALSFTGIVLSLD